MEAATEEEPLSAKMSRQTARKERITPRMATCLIFLGASWFFIWHTIPIRADIYRYVDSKGVIHFTNRPTSSDYKLYLRENNTPSRAGETPLLTNRYDSIISRAAKKHGIAFPLIKALIKAESDFNPQAISPRGAKGLMQIMPDNIKQLRIRDPFDPSENIMGGVRYLKQMLSRFDDKLPLALAAYNAGPGAVTRYRRIPPFKETEDFVERVMKYYNILKKG